MNTTTVVKISADDIERIIKKHFRQRNITINGEIKFDYGSRLEGFGAMERPVPYFGGCSFEIDSLVNIGV